MTESKFRIIIHELRQIAKDAKSNGIEINGTLARAIAKNTLINNKGLESYITNTLGISDALGHLADRI